MVQILLRDDISIRVRQSCLRGIHSRSSPRYVLFPSGRVTYFGRDGSDLLPLIMEHYQQHPVSPVVRLSGGAQAVHTTISEPTWAIEFPYLCYAFIDRIEVDVSNRYPSSPSDSDLRIAVSTGNVYLLERVQRPPPKEVPDVQVPVVPVVRTIIKQVSRSQEPSTYLKYDASLMVSTARVHSVRIYGLALSLW